MGRVYRAFDRRLQRYVALKVLTAATRKSDAARRMLREARAAAAFDHPHAVQVFDVGVVGEEVYIAMELVEGRPLSDFVGADEVGWSSKLDWLVAVAKALAAAHRAGLVHRDVKPDNVMLRDDGLVKVLDFGIAQLSEAADVPEQAIEDAPTWEDVVSDQARFTQEIGRLTQEGAIVGTPAYMAPEQLLSLPLDGRADQFSWAVMAYELFAGVPPWPSENLSALVAAVVRQPVPAVPDASGLVPQAVHEVILRALSKDPDERFADMDALLAALLTPMAASTPPPANASRRPEVPASNRSLSSRGPVTFVLALLSVAAVVVFTWSRRPGPPVSVPPSVSAAPSAVAITDSPLPPTTSDEARRSYVAALQALRDGAGDTATRHLEQAVAADPDLAAAHLRLAYSHQSRIERARAHYRKAEELRGQLSEVEQSLLLALEPLIREEPADYAAARVRFDEALARFPGNAEIALQRAMVIADLRQAVEALERALQIDPAFARAWWLHGQRLAYLGDVAGALSSFARCLDVTKAAVHCYLDRIWIHQLTGQCAEVERDARSIIRVDPHHADAYYFLAEALFALGRSPAAVGEALAKKSEQLPENQRVRAAALDDARLAILGGDFATAEGRLRAALDAARDDQSESAHAEPTLLLVDLFTETARADEAGQLAARHLEQREAWTKEPRTEDFGMGRDPTVRLYRAQLAAGQLSRSVYREQRDAWVSAWEERVLEPVRGHLWHHFYAAPARDAEDAEDALAAAARFAPVPSFHPLVPADAWIARVHRLAERWDRARTHGERAVASCDAVAHPFEHVHAALDLARVHEAEGDRVAACGGYDRVLALWGEAIPSPTSAIEARRGRSRLGCSAP